MADRHVTDEEIAGMAGRAPRVPAGTPKATCLNCGSEFTAFYTSQAHFDCLIKLREKKTYAEWLLFMKKLGLGVLKTPGDAKFPWDKRISGRQIITMHLQSDLFITPPPDYTITDYYTGEVWAGADFPLLEAVG